MMRIKHKWMIRFKDDKYIKLEKRLLEIDTGNINQFIKECLESNNTTSDKVNILTSCEFGFVREKDSEDLYGVSSALKKIFFDNIKNSLPSDSIHIPDGPYISNVYVYDDIIIADYYWFDHGDEGVSEEDKSKEFAKKLYELDLNNYVSFDQYMFMKGRIHNDEN